ncbi:dipeptide epimerase [Halalkalibaculum sp. DA384]|uniref:dipeptide epimerase n=1 Tax=Halalkalibaculum sp. DA384 TaxID=3373606 RepID=UPI003754095D
MPHFELEYQVAELRLQQVFTIARGSKPSVRNVFVRLHADGLTGYGEAAPNRRYDETEVDVVNFLEALPDDFFDSVDNVMQLSERLVVHVSRGSPPKQVRSARVAIEMAYLDWWAKKRDLPLWKLWGAADRTGPVTTFTIGLDELDVMQQKVEEAADYPVLKVKLGTCRDRQIIEALRRVTDKPLRVDANEGWKTLEEAKAIIGFLAGQGIDMVEQPMPARCFEEMTELKKYSPIPLCADESFEGRENLRNLSRAFDVINIKLMKTGSLVKSKQLIELAEKVGLEVMIGCMIESSLANSAGALLSLWADYADLDGHLLIRDDPFEGLKLDKEKRILVSNDPGLGVKAVTEL